MATKRKWLYTFIFNDGYKYQKRRDGDYPARFAQQGCEGRIFRLVGVEADRRPRTAYYVEVLAKAVTKMPKHWDEGLDKVDIDLVRWQMKHNCLPKDPNPGDTPEETMRG